MCYPPPKAPMGGKAQIPPRALLLNFVGRGHDDQGHAGLRLVVKKTRFLKHRDFPLKPCVPKFIR